MIILKTERQHFIDIELQTYQSQYNDKLKDYDFTELLKHENFTFIKDDKIIAICSIIKLHQFRYMLCSFVSKHAGKHMVALTREISKYINNMCNCRVETTVSPDFPQGLKWVKLLGFTQEGLLKRFAEDGSDQIMFSILR